MDDSAFFRKKPCHNGFEMRRVFPNCKPRLLSECFSQDAWEYMVRQQEETGTSFVRQWKEAGEDVTLIAETGDYRYDGNIVPVPANRHHPWLAAARGNIYYHGYWINRDWFINQCEDVLREELTFAPLADEKNKEYEQQIRETDSVALHVRRGDFLNCGWAKPVENYTLGVKVMRDVVPAPHFFIFSDDLEWCREHLKEMGIRPEEVTFVEGNRGTESYIDMQLMSYCKNRMLVTSSSFSYLAALLGRKGNGYIANMTGRET